MDYAGNTSLGLNASRPLSPLEGIEEQLRLTTHRLATARSRLGSSIDRIIGSRPEANNAADQGEPYCLSAWVDALLSQASLLESQIDRISI